MLLVEYRGHVFAFGGVGGVKNHLLQSAVRSSVLYHQKRRAVYCLLDLWPAAGVSGGPGEKKTLRSIIQKMERCCPALQHLPD